MQTLKTIVDKVEISRMLMLLGVSFNVLSTEKVEKVEVGFFVYVYLKPVESKKAQFLEHDLEECAAFSDCIYGMVGGEATIVAVFYKPTIGV
jgi:hypothetical protein